jgi:hypothetical protein
MYFIGLGMLVSKVHQCYHIRTVFLVEDTGGKAVSC